MPEFGLAGAEIMVEHLSIALHEDNYDVYIISLYNYRSAITDRLENNNIPIYYLEKKKGFDVKIYLQLCKVLKEVKPDVIHTHRYLLPYAVPVALFASVPVRVHTIHNIAEREVGKLQRRINALFYKTCKVVPVAISPIVKESVINEYNITPNRVPMIYNGIDLRKCIKKYRYNNSGKIYILHIGRYSEQKNHMVLIDCFKVVHDQEPNTVLRLIGSGDLENVVRQKSIELDLEDCIEFLGPKANVYSYLHEADIFTLPSLWEGMPITLIEAMATGLPIVATKVGGVPDMIEHGVSGLLVDVSREEISKALLRLVRDCSLRKAIGKAAILASEKFSAQEMAKNYSLLYQNIHN